MQAKPSNVLTQLRTWWRIISNFGVSPETPTIEKKKIRLLNQFAAGILPLIGIAFISDILQSDTLGLVATSVVFSFVLSVLYFQRIKWVKFVRYYLLVGFTILLTGCTILYGKELGGEYTFVVFVLLTVIFIDKFLHQVLLILFILGAFEFIFFWLEYHPAPLAYLVTPAYFHVVFFCVVLCVLAFTRLIQREHLRIERLSEELIQSVRTKNEELQAKQEEIKQKNLELERSNDELSKFAYIASHDLREPLQTIMGYSDLLAKRYQGELDEKGQKFLTYILNSTENMNQLIVDLLMYSRLNTQAQPTEHFPFQKLWEDVTLSLQKSIEDTGATLTLDGMPDTLYGKPTQLHQLFQNLVSNALKFHQPDKAPEIRLSYTETPTHVQFSVRDNGIGIAEKNQEKIFQIFTKLHNKKDYPGTGIGLALCKKVVEQHNGRIWLESVEGEGSTFHFTLARGAGY